MVKLRVAYFSHVLEYKRQENFDDEFKQQCCRSDSEWMCWKRLEISALPQSLAAGRDLKFGMSTADRRHVENI